MRLIRGRQLALPLSGAEACDPLRYRGEHVPQPSLESGLGTGDIFMTTESHEFEEKLWKTLQSDRTASCWESAV